MSMHRILRGFKFNNHVTFDGILEVFNLFNHANFALPNASAFVQGLNGGATPNPTFGKITSTTTTARQIQFALKLIF